jgi:excisionase family DNA binding protein
MKPETDIKRTLLTLAQVGEFLQQSADTVTRAIKRGQLRAYLLNSGRRKNTYRVSMEQLEAFLANREVNGKRKNVLRTGNGAAVGAGD